MNKNICLELLHISGSLPPAYAHPYHKQTMLKHKRRKNGISEKIQKLKKAEFDVLEDTYTKLRLKKKYKSNIPRINLSIVEKQNDRISRPLTCPSSPPKVYLDMSYQMFSTRNKKPELKQFHVRGMSIS